MRFPYLPWVVSQPIYPLGGSFVRHYPVFNIRISTPSAAVVRDGLLDTAADDTVFPVTFAHRLGIDLSRAPVGRGKQAGGVAVPYRYATVRLRLSDGTEAYEWQAIVGFLNAPMRWPLLGQTGVLQFFDAMLRGARREVEILPNAAFAGTHTVH